MRRIVLGFLAVVSLLVCASAVGLWVRSYWAGYSVSYNRAEQGETVWKMWTWHASVQPSCLYLQRLTSPPQPVSVHMGGPEGQVFELRPTYPAAQVRWYGEKAGSRWDGGFARRSLRWELGRFAWVASDGAGGEWLRLLVVPLYAVVLASAAWPVVWARGILGRRMAARLEAGGMCAGCGYDLRASAGRCPECGLACGQGGASNTGPLAERVNPAKWRPGWICWMWAMGLSAAIVGALTAPILWVLCNVAPPPLLPLP